MNNDNKVIRHIALAAVILLGIMIIATLVVAFVTFPGSDRVFIVLIGLDVFIPIFIWMFLYIVKQAKERKNSGNVE